MTVKEDFAFQLINLIAYNFPILIRSIKALSTPRMPKKNDHTQDIEHLFCSCRFVKGA